MRIYKIEKSAKTTMWNLFKKYHYLSHSHNNVSDVYIGKINDEIVAFYSILPLPHPKIKNGKREHRLVVMPDYQGIGIGGKMSDEIADIYLKKGCNFYTTTTSPQLIKSRLKNKKWKLQRLSRNKTGKVINKKASNNRITASFKYVG